MSELNPYKAKLAAGKPALGMLVSTPSATMTQVLSRTGLDWLFIDMEHAPIDIRTCHAMIAATAGSACAPMVRVPWNLHYFAKPALDSGALGIIFPMIRTAEDAKAAVDAVRYPPVGERGIGPFYAPSRWGLSQPDYLAQASDNVVCHLLIEHIDAVHNLDAILAVPGVDVAQIAPFDLSASVGKPGKLDDPQVAEAIREVEARVPASGVALGGLARDASHARDMIGRGYRAVLLGTDIGALQGTVAGMLETIGG